MASPTDYKYATTTANITRSGSVGAWQMTDAARTDDGNVSQTDTADKNGAVSDWLRWTNFGFTASDIPTGNTIVGIEVVIERRTANANTNYDSDIRLVSGGSPVGDNLASATLWPTTLGTATYGGSTNTWGAGLTRDNVLDSSFGIQLSAQQTGSASYIDYLKIRVYYTEGGGKPHYYYLQQ